MIGGRARNSPNSRNLHFAPRQRRRAPWRLIAVLAVVVALLAVAAVAKAAVAAAPALTEKTVLPASQVLPGPLPKPAWPAAGQAAVEVEGLPGLGSAGASTPQPIASLAKVMTAYVVLKDHPIAPGQTGFTTTVTPAELADYQQRLAQAQSVVPVATGENLNELQLLQGLLVASGNNYASILADYDAGSEPAFVAKMEAAAKSLGLAHSTYTDPSGLASSTVSTASDQLVLAARAMANPVFAQTVALPTVTLPVAGQLANFNTSVGKNGYVGVKTGSDSTAGGCLIFASHQSVGGRVFTILGVVLGQDRGQQSTSTLIGAAVGAADALVHSVTSAVKEQTVVPAATEVAVVTNPQGKRVSLATTTPLTLLGYSGMTVPLTISLGKVGTHLGKGQAMGQVSIPGGAQTDVRAASTMAAVTFGWKLVHDH